MCSPGISLPELLFGVSAPAAEIKFVDVQYACAACVPMPKIARNITC